MSGLQLNLPKTVMVPLFRGTAANILQELLSFQPGWGGLKVADHATYLGFVLGPGRGHHAYDKALAKYLDRAAMWGTAGGGLFATATPYSVYVASVISFLIQLDRLPPQWDGVEREALRRLVPGSTQWTDPSDLHNLAVMGFPRSFVNMRSRRLAAQFRVAHLEARSSGGLRVQERARALRQALRTTDNLVVAVDWQEWFSRGFLLQLDATVAECAGLGITLRTVEDRVLSTAETPRVCHPLPRRDADKLRRNFQKTVQLMLPRRTDAELERRLRHKFDRWRVDVWPRVRATNGLAFLRALRTRVPPRAWAAVWRALWNGWPTHRRTQGREGLAGCLFCCSDEAPDSLEHYASCQRVHAVAGQCLRLPRRASPPARLAAFLGIDSHVREDTDLAVRTAIQIAAVYRVHFLCRHGRVCRGAAAEEALWQSCREVVRGHSRAVAIYDAAVGWR